MAASELSKNDLVTVRGALLPAAIKWYDIGLELLIPPDTLDTIQSDKNDKSSLCLREMLKICLDKKPTWKMLIDALRTPAVNDQSLADDLTQKYCKLTMMSLYSQSGFFFSRHSVSGVSGPTSRDYGATT